MGNTRVTTDHNLIKQWAEKYQGKPAVVDAPEAAADDVGLRINFPGARDEALLADAKPSRDITWHMFFSIFEDKQLSFMYEDPLEHKDMSLTYRFVPRKK